MRRESLLLALIAFIGIVDTSAMIPTVAAYAKSLGASEALAGLVAGSYSYVAIPASLLAGFIVDVFGRKRSLVAGLLWDAVFVAAYSLARTPLHLAAARGMHALGGSLVYPALYARAAGIGEKPDIARLSVALGSTALAVAVGIIGGGVLAHILGFRTLYLIISGLLLVGMLLALLLPEERVPARRRAGFKEVASMLASARYQVLLGVWTIFAAYIGLGAVTGGLATAILRDGLALDEREASRITGVFLGASVALSAPSILLLGIIARRMGLRALGLTGIIASIGIGSYLVLGPTTAYAVIGVLGGSLALGSLILGSTVLVAMAPAEARGAAVGVQQVFNIVGVGIGAALGGAVSGYYGVEGVIALSALSAAAASLGPLAAKAVSETHRGP